MSYELHQESARGQTVRCAVVTISDTRTEETDRSGTLIRKRLEEHGHQVAHYAIVPDEPEMIGALLDELAGRVDAILTNGGTGISGRDTTYEVVAARLEKKRCPASANCFACSPFRKSEAAPCSRGPSAACTKTR